ncbi:hypothetical protein GQ457_04G038870 [Hibiscus cannabinus]
MLSSPTGIYPPPPSPARSVVSTLDIVWRPNGPDLNRLRKLVIREIMSKRSLDACYELRRREIRHMVKDIHRKIGSPVNLGEQVAQTTVKVMINTLWGGSSERSSDLIELRKRLDEFMLELNLRGDDKSFLSINEVKAVLLDMMVGGTDTIPTTVEWAMTELLRHPDIMRKLVDELDTVVEKQNMFPRLLYLDAVVKETLRLHPVIPLLFPARPPLLPDIPSLNIPGFSLMRRRVCVGLVLAEKMVSVLLAALLHSFEWEMPQGTLPDIQEKFGVVLKKKESLVAIPFARLSNPEQYK